MASFNDFVDKDRCKYIHTCKCTYLFILAVQTLIFVHSALAWTIAVNLVKTLVRRESSTSSQLSYIISSRRLHPGGCTAFTFLAFELSAETKQESSTSAIYIYIYIYIYTPLENTSNNGLVLTVKNFQYSQ